MTGFSTLTRSSRPNHTSKKKSSPSMRSNPTVSLSVPARVSWNLLPSSCTSVPSTRANSVLKSASLAPKAKSQSSSMAATFAANWLALESTSAEPTRGSGRLKASVVNASCRDSKCWIIWSGIPLASNSRRSSSTSRRRWDCRCQWRRLCRWDVLRVVDDDEDGANRGNRGRRNMAPPLFSRRRASATRRVPISL